MPQQLRSVVEDPEFCAQIEKLGVSYERLDEALRGVCLNVAAYPERFKVIKGSRLSIAKTRGYPKVPPLRIFFTYTDNEVHLVHAEVIGDGGDDAGERSNATTT